jgi:hypothetical protein
MNDHLTDFSTAESISIIINYELLPANATRSNTSETRHSLGVIHVAKLFLVVDLIPQSDLD